MIASQVCFCCTVTHGFLFFLSVFGEIQFGFRMGHSGWTFSFFSSLHLFTALFTMCDWVEVIGTTKKWRGVLFLCYFYLLTHILFS